MVMQIYNWRAKGSYSKLGSCTYLITANQTRRFQPSNNSVVKNILASHHPYQLFALEVDTPTSIKLLLSTKDNSPTQTFSFTKNNLPLLVKP